MRLKCWICGALGAVLALLCLRAQAADEAAAFEKRKFTSASGAELPYRLLKPEPLDPATALPLVLFFHGAGERGTDNTAQLKLGVKLFATPENRAAFPCLVVAPQCPPGKQWVDTPWSLERHDFPERPSAPMALALELLAALRKEFNVDTSRVYVVGVSMGGFGAWDALSRQPETFAAALPVCGGADEKQAPRIKHVPVWTFHGDKDGVVKTVRSRNMVAALQAAGGTPKYSEYPGVGHNSWDRAFKEPELLKWLFAQRKK